LLSIATPLRADPGALSARAVNDALGLLADDRPERASAELERLLTRAREAGDDRARGILLWGLASTRIEQRRYAEAAELAAAGAGAWERVGDPSWRRRCERLAAAARELERSLPPGADRTDRTGPADPILRVRFLQQLGLLELAQIRPGAALRRFDDALQRVDEDEHPVETAGLSLSRGLTLLLLRQNEAAVADLDRFSGILRREAPELVPLMSQFVDVLLAFGAGDLDLVLERIEAMGRTYGDHLPPVFSDFFELSSLVRTERWDEASSLCETIVNRSPAGETGSSLAAFQATQKALCAVIRVARASTGDGGGELPVLELLSLVHHLRVAIEEQPPVVQEALRSLLGNLTSIVTDGGGGDGDRAPSGESVGRTIESVQKLLGDAASPGLRAGLDSLLTVVLRSLITSEAGSDDPAVTFEHAEQVRAREFLDRLVGVEPGTGSDGATRERIAALRRRRDALEARLGELSGASWEGAPSSTPSSVPDGETESLRAELAGVRHDLDAAFRRIALRRTAAARVEPVSLTGIRRALGDDVTLVAFLTFPSENDDTLAWVVDSEELHQRTLPVRADELERRIRYFRRLLETRDELGALPEELYRDLWSPLEDLIATRRVLLVPHGPLQELPFAALRRPADGRWLVERHTLLRVPSATAYARLRDRPAGAEDSVLVLGDPDGSLPAARSEAHDVAALWSVRPLLGADASEAAFRRRSPDARVIHLASHGVAGHHDPLFSRLLLAASAPSGPSRRAPDDPRRDGRLELHEVMEELDLRGTELVVLSACSAGAGPRTGGDEVTNFARAVLLSGARSVVTAAWPVEDRATARLMVDLHRHLKAGGDAAEALRRAQGAAIEAAEPAHPADWAAFAVHGAPQPFPPGRVHDEERPGRSTTRGDDRTSDR
jgi:CHAT domain-containing protein